MSAQKSRHLSTLIMHCVWCVLGPKYLLRRKMNHFHGTCYKLWKALKIRPSRNGLKPCVFLKAQHFSLKAKTVKQTLSEIKTKTKTVSLNHNIFNRVHYHEMKSVKSKQWFPVLTVCFYSFQIPVLIKKVTSHVGSLGT